MSFGPRNSKAKCIMWKRTTLYLRNSQCTILKNADMKVLLNTQQKIKIILCNWFSQIVKTKLQRQKMTKKIFSEKIGLGSLKKNN